MSEPPAKGPPSSISPKVTAHAGEVSDGGALVRAHHADVTILQDCVPQRAPKDILQSGTAELRGDSPAALLNARHEIVPFIDAVRETELAFLKQWWGAQERTSARLFTGLGGAGKTRLFIEWTRRLRDAGHLAGFLDKTTSRGDRHALLAAKEDVFVVVDYAETRHDQLAELFEAVESCGSKTRLRIALVAREAGDWWTALKDANAATQNLLREHGPTRLNAVAVAASLRADVLRKSIEAFANKRGVEAPAIPPLDPEDPRFERPLFLQLLALAAVERRSLKADDLLNDMVAHEVHYWSKHVPKDKVVFERRARRLVAALTLRGRTKREELRALDKRVKGPKDEMFRGLIKSLYLTRDGGHEYIAGLEPDLLGEALVRRILSDDETPKNYLEKTFKGESPYRIENGFWVLGRIDLDAREEIAPWIERFLADDVPQRAVPALNAAAALGATTVRSSVGQLLAAVLARTPGSETLAPTIERPLLASTVSLREVAVWSAESLLQLLGTDRDDEKTLAQRARIQNDLGNRLSALGRHENALVATQEAVNIRRRLAKTQPDAFLPGLAMSLNNLGGNLSKLGRREDALVAIREAVDTYRTLAEARPDAFLPYLAGSLNNLGALGRRADALAATQEAVSIRRTLVAKTQPDTSLPYLAGSLNNLGAHLSELGRPEDALAATQEAVDTYRTLAKAQPDAFLPDLALVLNNLGNRLFELGRGEDALAATQEAIRIRRTLTQARPNVFLPDLAGSLNNLSAHLSKLGRREDALASIQEALKIRTVLLKRLPCAFRPGFTKSLASYRQRLEENEIPPESDQTLLDALQAQAEVDAENTE